MFDYCLKGISINFQEDIVSTPGKYINYRSRLGMEYRLSNHVKIRWGLKQAQGAVTSDEEINGFNFKPSFGAGIPLQIWRTQFIKLDYALDSGNVGEGFSHLFSFAMEIN